jgi:CoA:oxalate CoA-transferase
MNFPKMRRERFSKRNSGKWRQKSKVQEGRSREIKMKRPLEGVRVLDLGSYIAGPYGCMLLADHGAEVIRVEPPGGKVDREMGPFTQDGKPVSYGLTVQRNKRNITLNLRSETGARLFDELASKSDVVIHNYPKGTVESKLLEYERLKQFNKKLIVVAVSGFGQNGPYAERLCFDSVAQAMSGAMSITGYPNTPPLRAAVPFVDLNTAARVAYGTMLALYERNMSGEGQFVDIALFDVAFSMVGVLGIPYEYMVSGEVRKQVGNGTFYAYGGSVKAKDGYVMINVIGNGMWRRLCKLMKKEELITDQRFQNNLKRYRNYMAIDSIINEWIKDMTVADAIALLDKASIPCGPVNDIPSALRVPQISSRDMLIEVEYPDSRKVPVPGISIKLSRTPGRINSRASDIGEDNEYVYSQLLNYGLEQIKIFKEQEAAI